MVARSLCFNLCRKQSFRDTFIKNKPTTKFRLSSAATKSRGLPWSALLWVFVSRWFCLDCNLADTFIRPFALWRAVQWFPKAWVAIAAWRRSRGFTRLRRVQTSRLVLSPNSGSLFTSELAQGRVVQCEVFPTCLGFLIPSHPLARSTFSSQFPLRPSFACSLLLLLVFPIFLLLIHPSPSPILPHPCQDRFSSPPISPDPELQDDTI